MTLFSLRAGACALALMAGTAGMAAAQVTIVRGNDTDPATLDHHLTSTVAESRIMNDLYEGLVVQDAQAKVVPGVAESWEISEDGLTYTFKLRDDAKWSNGDPVVAEDFVFALRRIMTPATAAIYANILYPIANAEAVATGGKQPEELGVEAVDEHTLKFTLNAPTPYFLELLTHQSSLPMHRATVEAEGSNFTKPGVMVTNGAYKLVSFAPNDRIVMEKNEHFHDAANVAIDRVEWVPFEDRSACLRRFEADEVQMCTDVPAEQMAYMRENLKDELHVAPYLGTYYLPVKGADGSPLKDKRVRQAISMVLDRDFIAEEVWQETMLPGYSMVPPGISNYVETPPALDYADEDLLDREDKAKALLEEAGVAEGSLTVQLSYNSSENHRNTMTAIADMLKNIGINATLNEMEGTNYFNYLKEGGAFDIVRAGWIGDYSDPQNFLFLFEGGVPFNYPRWENADYDALMDKAAVTQDLGQRAQIMADAETILLDEVPAIPLLTYSSRALVSGKVQGYEDNLPDVHLTRWLSLAE
ncbi:peptide ABC transporter substrate-binding protein [Cereibacter johrii]|uniref:Oligopeptide transport system substrate-binding protein n=1 Tax=Cereibacter johrii TaxID=445629 RepID=A0ABX5J648_9RHOB|nr:peptide ABC transporter substrate-binding protein [Cereibacter johrii]ODM43777.1 ABC transporter substrate-binding protein [Cereibacter johrii]PTM76142.1 oligopeptide transport system substrate-binding protein [Cereibacter johrii]